MPWKRTHYDNQATLLFGLNPGIILGMGPANERQRYGVTLSLIGRAHSQKAPWIGYAIQEPASCCCEGLIWNINKCLFSQSIKAAIRPRKCMSVSQPYSYLTTNFVPYLSVKSLQCICGLTHWPLGGGWGCEVSCGGHHRPRGKTTTGSALDGAVFDIAQILAYLVHNISRSQLYLGFGHFGWLPSFFGQ